jgi:hypothetical protein
MEGLAFQRYYTKVVWGIAQGALGDRDGVVRPLRKLIQRAIHSFLVVVLNVRKSVEVAAKSVEVAAKR